MGRFACRLVEDAHLSAPAAAPQGRSVVLLNKLYAIHHRHDGQTDAVDNSSSKASSQTFYFCFS